MDLKTWRQQMRHDTAFVSVYPDPAIAREATNLDLALALLPDGDPSAEPLKARLDELKEKASSQELRFTFRGLSEPELEELSKKKSTDDVGQLEAQLVRATMGGEEVEVSREDWVDILTNLDVSQTNAIWTCANGLLRDQPSMPDF